MLRTSLVVMVLLAGVPQVGFAQDDVRERGKRACGNDVSRLCKKIVDQGDFAILGCLQQNASRIGASCRRFLQEQGQL
jgi:hypothetical protein